MGEVRNLFQVAECFGLCFGEGAELRTPMALTASTLLTLFVVPAVYVVLDRRA